MVVFLHFEGEATAAEFVGASLDGSEESASDAEATIMRKDKIVRDIDQRLGGEVEKSRKQVARAYRLAVGRSRRGRPMSWGARAIQKLRCA